MANFRKPLLLAISRILNSTGAPARVHGGSSSNCVVQYQSFYRNSVNSFSHFYSSNGGTESMDFDLSNEESKRQLVNRLLYRSKQRGFLELDLVLGSWVENHIRSLDEKGIKDLVDVLNLDIKIKVNKMEGKEVIVKNNAETEANNNEISEEEYKKIMQMRELVEKHDPTCKEYDDFTIRRFLRARDMDIDKASTMFLKYLKWRKTFLPNGSISVSEIPNDIAQNKLFMQGTDKSGRLITVVFGGRHYPNKIGGLEEFKRYVVFTLERIISRMPPGHEKFVSIADIQGWGYSNSDIRGYLAALSILQDYYPERLGKMFVVHAHYMFMAAWKMIYPFIDEKTKKKIVFVENKQLKSTLMKDIDESQIPEIYGGKLKLVPIQDS